MMWYVIYIYDVHGFYGAGGGGGGSSYVKTQENFVTRVVPSTSVSKVSRLVLTGSQCCIRLVARNIQRRQWQAVERIGLMGQDSPRGSTQILATWGP